MKPTQLLRALAVALLAVLALSWPASAASSVAIALTSDGPSPAAATSVVGQTVVFTNKDTVNHFLSGTAFGTSPITVPPNGTYKYAFTATGTFTYDDRHRVLIDDPGAVTVSKASSSPSPSASPSRSTSPSPSHAGSPSATPKPSASSGTALTPGLGTTVVPTVTPSPSDPPQPNIAPVTGGDDPVISPTPSATRSPAAAYDAHGLVQGSAHRYGLPAALAVVAITGVASLLVRLLLAQPSARPE